MTELQSIFQQPLGEITAVSTPDNPEDWTCTEWKLWHQALVQQYGRKKANDLWMVAWEKQSAWDYDFNFCKYNSEWVNYFRSQGMDLRSIFSAIITGGGEIVSSTLDTADKAIDSAGSVVSFSKYLIPAVVIGVVGFGAYFIIKRGDQVFDLVSSVKKKKK